MLAKAQIRGSLSVRQTAGKVVDQPFLSVIIPTWNEEDCVASLLNHFEEIMPISNYEIIVSDGGSTDATIATIRHYPQVRIVQARRGRARQLNVGACYARGQWLYFLHADTLPPDDLWEQLCVAEKRQLESACFSLRFDSQHPLLRFCSWCSRLNWNCFRYGDQSLLVRREVFHDCGGYREELEIMEDNEIVRRLNRRGHFQLLPAEVQTSARKYRYYGPIYLQSVYTLVYFLNRWGLSQSRLLRLYRYLLPPPQGKARR